MLQWLAFPRPETTPATPSSSTPQEAFPHCAAANEVRRSRTASFMDHQTDSSAHAPRQMVLNLSTLSTSAPAPSTRVDLFPAGALAIGGFGRSRWRLRRMRRAI